MMNGRTDQQVDEQMDRGSGDTRDGREMNG